MKWLSNILSSKGQNAKAESSPISPVPAVKEQLVPESAGSEYKTDPTALRYWRAEIDGEPVMYMSVSELLPHALKGNIAAQLSLASLYESGNAEVGKSAVESVRWMKKAILLGSEEAREQLDISLRTWKMDTLKELVDSDIEEAEVYLADAIVSSVDNLQGEAAKVVLDLYTRSLGRGNARAALGVAWLYYFGNGVPEDCTEAQRLASIALEDSQDDDVQAQARLLLSNLSQSNQA